MQFSESLKKDHYRALNYSINPNNNTWNCIKPSVHLSMPSKNQNSSINRSPRSTVHGPPSPVHRPLTAIYSGTIPTTVFIERLIRGLAERGENLVLFGSIQSKIPDYPATVRVHGNLSGWRGRVQAIFRIIHLMIQFPGRARILRKELKSFPWYGVNAFSAWKRHVPVLLNLPEIFHIQWAKCTEEWGYLKKNFGVKLILSLRGAHINYSPLSNPELAASYIRSFPQIDAFHAVSEAIGKEAVKYGADPDKIRVIYSGLPPLSDDISRIKSHEWESKSPFLLMAVGRFHWKKGYNYLLEALHLLRLKSLDIRLTLIASGPMPEELLYQIHEQELHNAVHHIQGLPFDQVQQAMLVHHVLVLPSLEEGIANVVLEAMQLGLPVISTDCGGMAEAIDHAKNGFLVPVRTPEDIAETIEELMISEESEITRITENARKTIHDKFNAEKAIDAFLELYKQT